MLLNQEIGFSTFGERKWIKTKQKQKQTTGQTRMKAKKETGKKMHRSEEHMKLTKD